MSGSMDARLRHECREWLTLLSSDSATDADRARFAAWREADPRRQRAYDKLQGIWDEIGELKHLAALEPVPPPIAATSPPQSRYVNRWTLAAAAIAAIAVAAVALRSHLLTLPSSAAPTAGAAASYSTSSAEVREIALADGSILTLGARSRAVVSLSAAERTVWLTDGAAFFAVASDPSRPFSVHASKALVRVLGTEFEVHSGPQGVRVAVANGTVGVSRERLTAGQEIEVARDGTLSTVRSIENMDVGSWRRGRFVYENTRLSDIVADLNRYRAGSIALASADLGELRVTAAFRTEQIDSFIEGLPSVMSVTLERDASGGISILARSR